MKKKNIKSCFTWSKVNVKKKHGFKRRIKIEKIFHVLEDILIYGKNRRLCGGGRAKHYRSIAEEAERRSTGRS